MDTPRRPLVRPVVVLVAFYNKKALGVRYLETALEGAGYVVHTIFYKDFNSIHPTPTTETELALLRREVAEARPVLVGLSVMSSMYLDTVYQVMDALTPLGVPLACGGAYATMFPQVLLERGAKFVLRSDGERSMVRLANALYRNQDWQGIPSLCFQASEGIHCNPIGDLAADVDAYGLPAVRCRDACFIDRDTLTRGDPQLSTRSYEVIASRGCPFTCSYCCCVNLRRLLPPGIPGVRTRSVESVISELMEAKKQCKKLVFVHFYDEIFPNLPGWVDAFCQAYQAHIHLPFTIWSHPKMVTPQLLNKLKAVGLTEVIMGIQSGSQRVRRDVFHRYESQQDILTAVRAIRDAGVWGSFDFMLQHPFETIEDLKASYALVKAFPSPYELQLHGLNFLPGTDIVDMAVQQEIYTRSQLEQIMYAPMEQQFGAYWRREVSQESQAWYEMLYCWQFPSFRPWLRRWEENPMAHADMLHRCYALAQRMARLRYLYKKGQVVLLRMRMST
ncbi:MAG: B12-binding domain-containing radical SAM protein [Lawsonibacter sp.]|jgi:anaerobic magnesium-protoporphyrin IX monomethyl ester cyclase